MPKMSESIFGRIRSIPPEKMVVCKKIDGRGTSFTQVRAFKVITNSTFLQMFNWGNGVNMDDLCLDGSEIKSFVEKYPGLIRYKDPKSETVEHGLIFLSKKGIYNQKYFVTVVHENADGVVLKEEFPLSDQRIFLAEYGNRIVVSTKNGKGWLSHFKVLINN